jgi:hypothetical protein
MDILITTLHTSLVELEFGDTPFFVLEKILEMFWWRAF